MISKVLGVFIVLTAVVLGVIVFAAAMQVRNFARPERLSRADVGVVIASAMMAALGLTLLVLG